MVSPTNPRLEAALQYAGRGWKVFAVGRSKIPFKGSHGHLDATCDPAKIIKMWEDHPSANVAMPTGSIVTFDCDGQEGWEKFKGLGATDRTSVVLTPRGGRHFLYQSPDDVHIRNKAEKRAVGGLPGLDIRGHGGYMLLPPSIVKGKPYVWVIKDVLATLPPQLIEYAQAVGCKREPPKSKIEVPAYLAEAALGLARLCDRATAGMELEWNAHEYARVWSALKSIGNKCGYDDFLKTGFSLHSLNWVRADGTDAGFDLWDQWAALFPETYNLHGLEQKWLSFGRSDYGGQRIGIGSLFKLAQEAGWAGTVELPPERKEVVPHVPGYDDPRLDKTQPPSGDVSPAGAESSGPFMNGHPSLPADFIASAVVFPDTDQKGKPKATCTNTRVAIEALSIACRKDVFHDRLEIGGHLIEQWQGEVSDSVVQMIRPLIYEKYGFDPGMVHANDAVMQLCLAHQFHPIRDYLATLRWDGTPRLGTWFADYLGAERSPLNGEFGRLALVAAVRRIRTPGTKFDEITVLEGPEGANKSTAIKIMAGDTNFSDQPILTLDDRAQQEAMRGVWIYEIADLSGIGRADTDRVKAFSSRAVDRARPAYGRHRIDMPRQCIFFGTTNNDRYLQSQTGNRRFWPVRTGTIRLAQLERDRDQLWAEAMHLEGRGASVRLGAEHWGAAGVLQDARLEADPWEDTLRSIESTTKIAHPKTDGTGMEMRVKTTEIFQGTLHMTPDRLHIGHTKRLAYLMRRLGWDGPKVFWIGAAAYRGYTKPCS